jgi:hypothetical protein
VFVVFQLLMANVLRPHFAEPVTETLAWADGNTVGNIDSFGIGPEGAGIQSFSIPGAWVISDYIVVHKGDGTEVTSDDIETCDSQGGTPDDCMIAMDATFDVTYQPADRYWTFQWIELGTTMGLSALLAGIAFWRLPRGLN